MNDPHVEKLYYRFSSEDPTDMYDKAIPMVAKYESFDIEMKEGVLTAIPHAHYPDIESAKIAFETLIRSWEAVAFLSPGRYRIHFRFDRADVIDRNPTPGVISIHVNSAISLSSAMNVTVSRSMSKYPEPDMKFVASDLTEELIYRLKQYKDGRETLPQVAYYVLERLEHHFVKDGEKNVRDKLGQILRVDKAILKQIGNFSNKTDSRIGRHASNQDALISGKELAWLEEAVFQLVKRAGEIGNVKLTDLPQIEMKDLPEI